MPALLQRIQLSYPWCDRPFLPTTPPGSNHGLKLVTQLFMSDVVRATFKEMAFCCMGVFTEVYHPIIDQWHQHVRDPSLQVTDTVSLRSVPLDLSSYADDVNLVQVRSTSTAIAERVNFLERCFYICVGFDRNGTKRW